MPVERLFSRRSGKPTPLEPRLHPLTPISQLSLLRRPADAGSSESLLIEQPHRPRRSDVEAASGVVPISPQHEVGAVSSRHVLAGIYQVEDDAQAEGKATEAADSAGLVVSSERQSSGRERTRCVLPFGVPRGARSWE
jgi:hypothetical protein